jgi:hypothetical protein
LLHSLLLKCLKARKYFGPQESGLAIVKRPGFLLRFFRKDGKIAELSVGLGRVRDLRFARR